METNSNNEQIRKYINNQLTGEELHQFEKQMLENEMLNDAVEGLSALENKKSIDSYVNDLNKHLQQYTSSKKKRRLKNKLELNDWTLLAILFIIAMCTIAYYVIKLKK